MTCRPPRHPRACIQERNLERMVHRNTTPRTEYARSLDDRRYLSPGQQRAHWKYETENVPAARSTAPGAGPRWPRQVCFSHCTPNYQRTGLDNLSNAIILSTLSTIKWEPRLVTSFRLGGLNDHKPYKVKRRAHPMRNKIECAHQGDPFLGVAGDVTTRQMTRSAPRAGTFECVTRQQARRRPGGRESGALT